MTTQRMYEIERKVFYQHIESIMKILEPCEDTHIIFEIGREMGYLHNDLIEELNKELEPELYENKVNNEDDCEKV